MIKYLGLLFIFTTLYGEQFTYSLPNQHSRFLHDIHQLLKNSTSAAIVSPYFHHTQLKKELQDAAKHGSTVSLMLNNIQGDPLSMVQYNHIDLYQNPSPVNISTLLIDNRLMCTFSAPIDEEYFISKRSIVQCSDSPDLITSSRHMLHLLFAQSMSYLK